MPRPPRRLAVAKGAAALAAATAVAALTVFQPGAAAAVCAAALAVAVLLPGIQPTAQPVDLHGKRFLWLSLAWAFVLIRPIGRYTQGRTALAAVEGVPSIEN